MRVVLISFVALVLLAAPGWAGQTAIEDYGEARPIFWAGVYPDGGETLYCSQEFDDRDGLSIEHVFPAAWMREVFDCPSRDRCRATEPGFNRMEADLHNLYPARRTINQARGSFPFGTVPGEEHLEPGCDFEVDRVAEPRPAARGEIARAVLYMADAYGAELPEGQRALMQAWDAADPPTAGEVARNERIFALQGTRNRFIDAHAGAGDGAEASEPGRLRLATWNLGNLHSEPGVPLRAGAVARSEADYARLREYAARLDADVIAVQEVNGPAAAHLVFPEELYAVVVSGRHREDLETGRPSDRIYTGFAVRRDRATIVAAADYADLSVPHEGADGTVRPTRRGVDITIETPAGNRLRLLSVHLKSACHQGSLESPNSAHCATLARQRAPLEAWIDARAAEDLPFVVLGDFNRRFDVFGRDDHLWADIDDADPPGLDLWRLPFREVSACFAGVSGLHHPEYIDFLVFDARARALVDEDSSFQLVYDDADEAAFGRRLSDHCAVAVDLTL